MSPRALVAALFLCLCGLVHASDYRLHLPESARSAINSKGIFVHDKAGVLKEGDWIMEVTFAPAPAGSAKVNVVWSNEKSSRPLLAPQGGANGFAGKIHKAVDSPRGSSVVGSVVLVSGPVPSTNQSDIIAAAKKKASNLPWILIGGGILGAVGLSSLWVARRRRGPAPLGGRKLYEENIREVHGFLERIIVAQKKLVKNPPVVRSFRKDIDGFKERLTALEDSARTLEARSSEIVTTLGNIEKAVRTISAVESRLSREIASSSQQTEKRHTEIEAKVDVIQSALPKMDKATEALHREVLSQASKSTIDLHSLSEAVKAGFVGDALRAEEQREIVESVRTEVEKLKGEVGPVLAAQQEHTKSLADLSTTIQSKVDKAVDGLNQKLAEEAKRSVAQESASAAKTEEVSKRIEALSKSIDSVAGSLSSESKSHKDALSALESVLLEVRSETAVAAQLATEKLESIAGKFGDLNTSQCEQIASLAEKVGNVRNGIDESMAQATKKIDEVIEKSSLDAAKRLDGLTEAVTEVRQNASELAKELSAARTDHGSLTKSLEKQAAQADSAVAKLGEKLQSIEKQAEGLAKALSEQTKRLTAFENLDRAVSALQEDLRNLSNLEVQKKDASVDGVEVTKKLASTQSLRLEQISQEVRGIQDAIKPLHALSDALVAIQSQVAEVSSRPVPAPVESVTSESFDKLSNAVDSIQASLKDLSKLPSEVDQKLASMAIAGSSSEQSSEALVALSQVATSVESLRAELASAAGVADAVQKLSEQLSTTEAKSDQRFQSLESKVDAKASSAESDVAALKSEVESARAEARARAESEAAAKSKEAASAKRAAEVKPEFKVVDGGKEEAEEAEDVSIDLASPVVLRVEDSEPDEVEQVVVAIKSPKVADESHTTSDPETRLLSKQSVHLPGRKMPWALAGGSAGRSSMVESTFELGAPIDTVEAKVATATPDPATPVGSIIFTGEELAYLHGEHLKTFWPGQNDRAIELEGSAGSEQHRLMWWDDHLFVAKDSSVDVYDLEDWSKSSTFEGGYLDQTSTLFHWVGIQSMNGLLAIDFRNLKGKRIGQPRITNASALEPFQTATAANAVYLASEDGRVFRATDQGVEAVGQLDGSLLTISSYGANLVALTKTQTGVKAHLQQVGDKPRKTIDAQTEDALAQGVVMGDRFYFVDRSGSQIKVLNVPKFKIADSIPIPGLGNCVNFVGLSHGSHHWLALAIAPTESTKGAIRLVNPDTGETREIATVGHPQVRLLFAHGHLVVFSGSAYQNIMRVFDPFRVAEHSMKSAA